MTIDGERLGQLGHFSIAQEVLGVVRELLGR
jgi:hypothetical protein